MYKFSSFLALTCLLFWPVTHGWYFEDGFDHHYTYAADTDMLGMHNVTTVIKFQVRTTNGSYDNRPLHMLTLDSFVMHLQTGQFFDNPQKWDLLKRFYFTVEEDGSVQLVHSSVTDNEEVIALKKMLTSTVATKIKKSEEVQWKDTSTEACYTGKLEFEYHGQRHSAGTRIERNHKSISEVHRHHWKLSHLDVSGTPLHVECMDNVTFHRTDDNSGEAESEDWTLHHDDFKYFTAVSKSVTKLEAKRKHYQDHWPNMTEHQIGTIMIQKAPVKEVPLSAIRKEIEGNLTCVLQFAKKVSQNKTDCVHNLNKLIRSLPLDDFEAFAKDLLQRPCTNSSDVCMHHKHTYMDAILSQGSTTGQRMILDSILLHPTVSDEEVTRCLFHCIALQTPAKELLEYVEGICFHEDDHNTRSLDGIKVTDMSDLQMKACLAMGSLAKSITEYNDTEADRIVAKLEQWLEHHNHTHTELSVKPRLRRSLAYAHDAVHAHVESKMVLIHSLGNAGRNRSFSHIISYMHPNKGVTAWRRAATIALKHITSDESASAIFSLAKDDADRHVRSTAINRLHKHPMRHHVVDKDTFEYMRNENRTDRVKRSAGNLHAQSPKYDWSKIAGSKKLGAGILTDIDNGLDGDAETQSTKYKVDTFNDGTNGLLFGLVDKTWPIASSHTCYNGQVKYNMNTLKDFDPNKAQELANKFDKVISETFGTIQRPLKEFRISISNFKSQTIHDIFTQLADCVEDIPSTFHEASTTASALIEFVSSFEPSPQLQRLTQLSNSIHHYVDDVKSDAIRFYKDIVDPLGTTLHYVEGKITRAFNDMNKGQNKLVISPRSSTDLMTRALSHLKMAMAMLLKSKRTVQDVMSIDRGRLPYWLSVPQDIGSFSARFTPALNDIKSLNLSSLPARNAVIDNIYSDNTLSQKTLVEGSKTATEKYVQQLQRSLDKLQNTTEEYLARFSRFVYFTKHLKDVFIRLRNAIQRGNSKISEIFGPVVHASFPKSRRKADTYCSKGLWPTTTDGLFKTIGMDLNIDVGNEVVAPVDGIVKAFPGRIIIYPTSADYNELEFVIDNVKVKDDVLDIRVPSGTVIGNVMRSLKCSTNFLHFSARIIKYRNVTLHDTEYDYVDPSRYVDNTSPDHEWDHGCDDYSTSYFGQVITSERLGKSSTHKKPKVKRNINTELFKSGFEDIMSKKDDDIDINLTDETIQSLRLASIKLGHHFEGGLYGSNGPSIPDVSLVMSKESMTTAKMMSLYKSDSNETRLFRTSLRNAQNKLHDLVKKPSRRLSATSITVLHSVLRLHGILQHVDHNTQPAIDASLWLLGKECPTLRGLISPGSNIFCLPHVDCLSIACYVDAGISGISKKLTFNLSSNVESGTFILFIDNQMQELTETDAFISTGVSFGNHDVSLVPEIHKTKENEVYLTMHMAICNDHFHSCSHTEELFRNWFLPAKKTGVSDSTSSMETAVIDINTPVVFLMHGDIGEHVKFIITRKTFLASHNESAVRYKRDLFGGMLGKFYEEEDGYLNIGKDCDLEKFLKDVVINNWRNEMSKVPFVGPIISKVVGEELPDEQTNTFQKDCEIHRPNIYSAFEFDSGLCVDMSQNCNPKTMLLNVLKDAGKQLLNELKKVITDDIVNTFIDGLTHLPFDFDFADMKIGKTKEIPLPSFSIPQGHAPALLYPIPPVIFEMSFGFDAGLSFEVGLQFYLMEAKTEVSLAIRGVVKAFVEVDVSLPPIAAGLRLSGYVLDTKYTLVASVEFKKTPLKASMRHDMSFTPFAIEFLGFVDIKIPFIGRVAIYEGTIFKYSTPVFTGCVYLSTDHADDKVKATWSKQTLSGDVLSHRSVDNRGCNVRQLIGRNHDDPAYALKMYAEDDLSNVILMYTIGTYPGGTNLLDWTEMEGNTLISPSHLPGGIPLYWTAKAKNTQGLEALSTCHLSTYDSTLPDGRVEHNHRYSSHPAKLYGSVYVYEDSQLERLNYKSLGLSPGEFGSEISDWEPLFFDTNYVREYVVGMMKLFSAGKSGKLVAFVINSVNKKTPEECADHCVKYGSNCISFDYEMHSETCDLHDTVESAERSIVVSGTYKHYERLGSGYHVPLKFENMHLKHGETYFLNVKVTNILGYVGYIFGKGTMVDLTPPEPGVIINAKSDKLKADGCSAAITQTCEEVTWKENHRIIVDGPGSNTVFNGNQPVQDTLFTLTNHYATANWKGFHDDESGISGYTWAVGTTVCGTDIVDYENPYEQLTSKKYWTDSALHTNIHMDDGPYYVTVQALNSAQLGGSLVCTVCHSTPLIVDTTSPVFGGVNDIIYDEDFDLIAVYYNANDTLSGIAKTEFGLGKSKYDVLLKRYGEHPSLQRHESLMATKELGLQEGIPAWIRIRVTNKVDLFTTGHGDEPILIDKSPPIAGQVFDGNIMMNDMSYQADKETICAQWVNFYDPESGIDKYTWGVGSKPFYDDIVPLKNLTRYDKSGCTKAHLLHNTTYFSTVFAYNNALNSKSTNNTSDGVLVDLTPPMPGEVNDGNYEPDVQFTSETVRKSARWDGFYDFESGIRNYNIEIFINEEMRKDFKLGDEKVFKDDTISMQHLDHVYFKVHGFNGAGVSRSARSDGIHVDLTPPIKDVISDNPSDAVFQSRNDSLCLKWKFHDDESGIKEYRTSIFEQRSGVKRKVWPIARNYNSTELNSLIGDEISSTVSDITLNDGSTYILKVTAINKAKLSDTRESNGVTIDTSPPSQPKVHIGEANADEEIDENGFILHSNEYGIRVSWHAVDSESLISSYSVAIGTHANRFSVMEFRNFGGYTTAFIDNIFMEATSKSGIIYVISVKAENGAGLISNIGVSKEIFVQKANIPGEVLDGRDRFKDEQYSDDRFSIAASFFGFESESCGIMSYQWAVGTTAYGTDISTFTMNGLVMLNETHGQCQMNIELFEGTKYFIYVRAITGCVGQHILSCSDGVTIDTTPPEIRFVYQQESVSMGVTNSDVVYQRHNDDIGTSINVKERQKLESVVWAINTVPTSLHTTGLMSNLNDLHIKPIVLSNDLPSFLFVCAVDLATNEKQTSSKALHVDSSAPVLQNLSCSNYLSYVKTELHCRWNSVFELNSEIKSVLVSLALNKNESYILKDYKVPYGQLFFVWDLHDNITADILQVNVEFKVTNVVDLATGYGRAITVDHTVPEYDGLAIVTSTAKYRQNNHQFCQESSSFIELLLTNALDPESGIDHKRYQIAIGSKPLKADIKQMSPIYMNGDGYFFIGDLNLHRRQVFFATLRICNNAGLCADSTSDSGVVSISPFVTVKDGNVERDVDYIPRPNVIEGTWKYSDMCLVHSAQWMIVDANDNVIKEYTNIQSVSHYFYNDEIQLENGRKYYVQVKTYDDLNRTKVARSDGFTVRIQPPIPGHVRDGLFDDINYQQSLTELSANWEPFGDSGNNDPTQFIDHYEVAVGNDRRYEKTRCNVHLFTNVGTNTSFTLKHLNLTAKTVNYYVTVRAVSLAGGSVESTSNGIRVGFVGAIMQGVVLTSPFQSFTNKIEVAWKGFYSDIGIRKYSVGLSSRTNFVTNESVECSSLESQTKLFDIADIVDVALNEYVVFDGLSLEHNHDYFATIIGHDESSICTAVSSNAIKVDTTPPERGIIEINDQDNNEILFATDTSSIHVELKNFTDIESGIQQFKIDLYECKDCVTIASYQSDCSMMLSKTVMNQSVVAFYELDLSSSFVYIVAVTVINKALLHTTMISPVIMIDTTSPLKGDVYISDDWSKPNEFQSSPYEISGKMALVTTMEDYICENQIIIYPSPLSQWRTIPTFSREFIENRNGYLTLGLGYNSDLTKIIRSAIESEKYSLNGGNYTFDLKPAHGLNVITTIAVVSTHQVIPLEIENKPEELKLKNTVFSEQNTTGNASENDLINSKGQYSLSDLNITKNVNDTMDAVSGQGFGVHVLGYRIGNNTKWFHILWARNRYSHISRWFETGTDLSQISSKFTISVFNHIREQHQTIDIKLIIDNKKIAFINGFAFEKHDLGTAVLTWLENGYKPDIDDVYRPFYSSALLSSLKIPKSEQRLCLHGQGFYDPESSIKEIRLGVSDSRDEIGNVLPLSSFRTLCYFGEKSCKINSTYNSCNNPLYESFQIVDLSVKGLALKSPDYTTASCLKSTPDITSCNVTSYYLNVEVINFAGLSTIVYSNSIQVDQTPPICKYVKCLNPELSDDEPTEYLGSSTAVGAYWKFEEDFSQIEHYLVRVEHDLQVVMNKTNVGVDNRANFNLKNGTFLDGLTYNVVIEGVNTAGLSTECFCSVLTYLYPPDVSNVVPKDLFLSSLDKDDNVTSEYLKAENMALTSSQTNIGLTWNGGNNETQYYLWQIGSSSDKEDLFPQSIVSNSPNGSVAIVSGRVEVNGLTSSNEISYYKDISNMTFEEQQEHNIASEEDKSFFQLEPGRCVYQSLYASGLSQIKQKICSRSVCMKCADGVLITKPDTVFLAKQQRKGNSSYYDIAAETKINKGGIIMGTLTETDKKNTYGSAASSTYRTYLSDYALTRDQTSRLLHKRIKGLCGKAFYISPAPYVDVNTIHINVTLDNKCLPDRDFQPALIYWNTERLMWVHIEEGCNDSFTFNVKNELFSSEICLVEESSHKHSARTRRTTTSTLLQNPRAFELVHISKQPINTKPRILTSVIEVIEDKFTPMMIYVHDEEHDDVTYNIIEQPKHAECRIDEEGLLMCELEIDFNGKDEIVIAVYEVDIPAVMETLFDKKSITINISPYDDPTERVFIDPKGKLFRTRRPEFNHLFIIEANGTDSFFAGTVVLVDVDVNETFSSSIQFVGLHDSSYTINESEDTKSIELRKMLPVRFKSIKSFQIAFKFNPEINGNITLKLISQSSNGAFTPSVTLTLSILSNPCVHGRCYDKHDQCNSLDRSVSFNGYNCRCDAGFDGIWCQHDIDECSSQPCALMYDCEDLIDNYRCNINIPKLMAILICSLLAIVGAIILFKKLVYKRYFNNKVTDSSSMLLNESIRKTYELPETRPTTSASIHLSDQTRPGCSLSPNIWDRSPLTTDADISGMAFYISDIGRKLPPHHRRNLGKGSQKPSVEDMKEACSLTDRGTATRNGTDILQLNHKGK